MGVEKITIKNLLSNWFVSFYEISGSPRVFKISGLLWILELDRLSIRFLTPLIGSLRQIKTGSVSHLSSRRHAKVHINILLTLKLIAHPYKLLLNLEIKNVKYGEIFFFIQVLICLLGPVALKMNRYLSKWL